MAEVPRGVGGGLPFGGGPDHSRRVRSTMLGLCWVLLGCAGTPVAPRKTLPPPPAPAPARLPTAGTLDGALVDEAIEDGLGRFLQKVDLEPKTAVDDTGAERFVGFQIVAMRPMQRWVGFDFAPGDVVVRINGQSIEHYDVALQVFEGLKTAQRIEVELWRDGASKTVVVPIARKTTPATVTSRPKSATSAAAP